MRIIMRIMKTELRVLFYSPIAWLILIIFAVQAGITFTEKVREYYLVQVAGGHSGNLTLMVYFSLFRAMLDNLYLYVPLLTMGLMSRETGSGSIKLLYSSPVSNGQIILGKYLAMLIYGLGFVVLLGTEVLAGGAVIENFDWGMPCVALLAFYLTFCTYTAIGLFMSTITQYQVVAAMGTLAVLAVLSFIGGVGQDLDFVREITWWLSVTGRTKGILNGIIGTADVLYFILVVGLFLSLSVLKLRNERSRFSGVKVYLQYGAVLLLVLGCGYLTSRPGMIWYYDATRTQRNTLSAECREIVEKLDGDLTLTTYVNYLDGRNFIGMPNGRMADLKRFEKYFRYKPDLKMKYVFYYHRTDMPYMWGIDQNLDDRTRMEKLAEIDNLDLEMFLSCEQLAGEINLAEEHFEVVRRFEYANGKKAFLRIFDDMEMFPSETEVASALKTLIEKSPVVAFSVGHGEKSIEDTGERGFEFWAKGPTYRQSLINKGFTVMNIALKDPVADSVDVLVIADLHQPMVDQEIKHLAEYLDRGGNLLLMGEQKRVDHINPVAGLLGLKFSADLLVQPSSGYRADWITPYFTAEVAEKLPFLSYAHQNRMTCTMTAATAIEQVEIKGFEVTDMLKTAEKGVWNEKQTTGFEDEIPVLNMETGEIEQAYVVAKYLTREIDGKKQQIFVLGDADCMTPAVCARSRNNWSLPSILFEQLTDHRFPVYVTLYPPIDNKIILSFEGMEGLKKGYVFGVPCLILLLAGGVWFRRRRK